MNNNKFFKLGVIALSIVLIACTGGSEAGCPELGDRNLNVVATTPMMGEFVDKVAGDNVNLTVLMPAEADPHTYEPAPQDAGTIADADLVFYTGLKYEPAAVVKLLENSACSQTILAEIGENVFPIEFQEGGHDDHDDEEGDDEHEGHDHGAYDPHFWFDPGRVVYAVEYIESKLTEFDPDNESDYQSSLATYKSELRGLAGQVSDLLSTVPSQNRKLITTHESLGYLEAKFGLQVLSTIIPDVDSANEISPAQLVDVIDVIEDNNVKVIFIEAEAPSVYAETIVAETGIKAVEGLWVETLKEGQTYPEFLISAVELIVENLRDTD